MSETANDRVSRVEAASHTYEIVEAFTAVEATSPPARQAGRDAPPA